MNRKKIRWLSSVAILSSLATVTMLIEFPLFFAPNFYKMDFSEVPVMIGAFALGPIAAVVIEAIKIILNFALNGTDTFGIGEIANFLMGIAFTLPAAILYRRHRNKKSALIGLGIGIVSLAILGSVLNAFVLLPVYAVAYGAQVSDFVAMGSAINPAITNLTGFIMLAVLPFNLLKGISVSAIVLLLYKRVSFLIHGKEEVIDEIE